MFAFATPLALLLLLPWAAAAWRLYRAGRRAGVLFAPAHRLPTQTAGWRVAVARLLPALFLFGVLLMIVAAARPRTLLARERRAVDAIAIQMVVDVSGSMEGLDLTPPGQPYRNRLEVVKELFSEFVAARPDDLIGLVTFGGFASTRAPLTADHRALLHVLRGVEIPSQQVDAHGRPLNPEEALTAVGDGLATGLARLQDAEPTTRIAILLSDGESNTGIFTPAQAAEAAAKLGIRVYAIGVGTDGRTPYRVRDAFGQETIAYVDATFDESQLVSIAETTGGRYFHAKDNEGLKRALDEINALETTPIDRQIFQRYRERFVHFLLAGSFLAALAITLNMSLARRLL